MKQTYQSMTFVLVVFGLAILTIWTGCSDKAQPADPEEDPACSVEPLAAMDFGNITLGQASTTKSFSITNTGGGTLAGSISASCDDFEITSGSGNYYLTNGQSIAATVRFVPKSQGTKTCTIVTGTACDVSISCSGTGVPEPPVCNVSPATPLDFGSIQIGQTSLTQSFTITNTGGGTLSGTVSETCDDFDIAAGSGEYNLTHGQATTVTVQFTPQSEGTKTCTIETGASCETDISCSGIGTPVPPVCSVSSETALDFGQIQINQVSEPQSFTITNIGGGTLAGTVSVDCAEFEIIAGGGDYSLPSGESVTVTIRFVPQSEGTENCTIGIGASCSLDLAVNGTGTAIPPECSVDPITPLDFGNIQVGQESIAQFFTITNTGGGILSGIVGESCPDFKIMAGNGGYDLTSGQSVTIAVQFAPLSEGTKDCVIQTGAPCSEDISCSGTAGPILPICSISSLDPLGFGNIQVGQASPSQSFTITNTGGGTLSGTVSENCADFEITAGTGNYNLTSGQSVTVSARFVPKSEGAKSCTIETGTACNEDISCNGTGTPIPPICSISPATPLNFGNVEVDSTSQSQSFTITNIGGGILSGTVSESCPDFEITSGGGTYNLINGESVTVGVRFVPQSEGLKNCTIEAGASCNADIPCSGTGVPIPPVCSVVPATPLTFDNVQVGSASATKSFVITNTGGGTLSGTVSEICTDFQMTAGSGPYNLATGQSVTVSVRFVPLSEGTKSCTIETGASCSADISCSGTGASIPPVCSVTPVTPLDFGSVQSGQASSIQSFNITNIGEGTLSGTVSENCADFEITAGGGAYDLTNGQSVTVSVRFVPQSEGTKSCIIETGVSCGTDISCSGIGTSIPPVCSVTPSSALDFDSTQLGQASSTQSFDITNTGGGILSGIVSVNCADFEITAGSGAYNLANGQSVTVSARFVPQSEGAKSCTIETGVACSTDITCNGVGVLPPICSIDSELRRLDFGDILVGDSSNTSSFTITNTGAGILSGTIGQLPGADDRCESFEIVSGGGSYDLSAGQSRTVQIRFSPQSEGIQECHIGVGSACGESIVCVGTGALPPACGPVPDTLDFGTGEAEKCSRTLTLTISNIGGGTLTGSVIEDCADFRIVEGDGSYSLPAGGLVQVKIRFCPQSPGLKTCTLVTGCSANVFLTGFASDD